MRHPGFYRVARWPLWLGIAAVWLGSAAYGDGNAGAATAVPQSLLLEYLADNSAFTLVDARSPEEFGRSHISGAINVPLDSLDESTAGLPDAPDALIVVYCKTGKRAALLQSRLIDRGYTNVRVLRAEQIFWFDDMAVFNCATPSSRESAGEETASLADKLLEDKR